MGASCTGTIGGTGTDAGAAPTTVVAGGGVTTASPATTTQSPGATVVGFSPSSSGAVTTGGVIVNVGEAGGRGVEGWVLGLGVGVGGALGWL